MQHPKCCTKNLTAFKFDPTSSNMLQHIATGWPNVCNMSNNAARCCVEMLRAFGQALIKIHEAEVDDNGTKQYHWIKEEFYHMFLRCSA